MRFRVTILIMWLALALASASGDTIHLKNGRTIVADSVREKGNHYEYEVGDDSYAIPKSAVDHIDPGGMPARAISSARGSRALLPRFTPADNLANEGHLESTIVNQRN